MMKVHKAYKQNSIIIKIRKNFGELNGKKEKEEISHEKLTITHSEQF